MSLRATSRFTSLTLLWLATAGGLSAQQAPDPDMPDAHGLVLGGATVDTERPHFAGGVTAAVALEGWGLLGLGMVGKGGDYDSTLLGGALSRRVMRGASWSLLVFGGYSFYGERGPTDIERDAHGVLFGATARWRVGDITLAGVFSHVTGTYDKADVAAPFRFHVPRISLGVGF